MDSNTSWYGRGHRNFYNIPSTSGAQCGRTPDNKPRIEKPDTKDIIGTVCFVDPEEAVNNFHNTTRRNILLPFTGVEVQNELRFLKAIKQFKMILGKKVEVLTQRKNLRKLLYKYLIFFSTNYARIGILYKEQYLDVMEDILVFYCDVIRKYFRDQRNEKQKVKMVQESRRIKILFRDCLMKRMDRILQVLLKVRLAPELDQYSLMWGELYIYFLTQTTYKRSDDDILRGFIAFQKLKIIRARTEAPMIDKLICAVYKKTTSELSAIPCLAEIMDKMKNDRLYTVRDMVDRYMRYYKEKRSFNDCSELDDGTTSSSSRLTERRRRRRRGLRKYTFDLDGDLNKYNSFLSQCNNGFSLFVDDITKQEAVEEPSVVILDDEDDDVKLVSDNLKIVITIDHDEDEPLLFQAPKTPPPREVLSPDKLVCQPEEAPPPIPSRPNEESSPNMVVPPESDKGLPPITTQTMEALPLNGVAPSESENKSPFKRVVLSEYKKDSPLNITVPPNTSKPMGESPLNRMVPPEPDTETPLNRTVLSESDEESSSIRVVLPESQLPLKSIVPPELDSEPTQSTSTFTSSQPMELTTSDSSTSQQEYMVPEKPTQPKEIVFPEEAPEPVQEPEDLLAPRKPMLNIQVTEVEKTLIITVSSKSARKVPVLKWDHPSGPGDSEGADENSSETENLPLVNSDESNSSSIPLNVNNPQEESRNPLVELEVEKQLPSKEKVEVVPLKFPSLDENMVESPTNKEQPKFDLVENGNSSPSEKVMEEQRLLPTGTADVPQETPAFESKEIVPTEEQIASTTSKGTTSSTSTSIGNTSSTSTSIVNDYPTSTSNGNILSTPTSIENTSPVPIPISNSTSTTMSFGNTPSTPASVDDAEFHVTADSLLEIAIPEGYHSKISHGDSDVSSGDESEENLHEDIVIQVNRSTLSPKTQIVAQSATLPDKSSDGILGSSPNALIKEAHFPEKTLAQRSISPSTIISQANSKNSVEALVSTMIRSAGFAEEKNNEIDSKVYGNDSSRPDSRLSQPDLLVSRPDSRLSQPDSVLSQPDSRISRPDSRLTQARSLKISAKDKHSEDYLLPKSRDISLKANKSLIKGVSRLDSASLNEGSLSQPSEHGTNFFWDSDSDAARTEEEGSGGTISVKPDAQLYQSKKEGGVVGNLVENEVQEKQPNYLDYSFNSYISSQKNANVLMQPKLASSEIINSYDPNLNLFNPNVRYFNNDKIPTQNNVILPSSENLEINPNLLHSKKTLPENFDVEEFAVSRSTEETHVPILDHDYMFKTTEEVPYSSLSNALKSGSVYSSAQQSNIMFKDNPFIGQNLDGTKTLVPSASSSFGNYLYGNQNSREVDRAVPNLPCQVPTPSVAYDRPQSEPPKPKAAQVPSTEPALENFTKKLEQPYSSGFPVYGNMAEFPPNSTYQQRALYLPDISTLKDPRRKSHGNSAPEDARLGSNVPSFNHNFIPNSKMMAQSASPCVGYSVAQPHGTLFTQMNNSFRQTAENFPQNGPSYNPTHVPKTATSEIYRENFKTLRRPKLEDSSTSETQQESLQKTLLPLKKRKLTEDEELAIYIQKFKEEKERKMMEMDISYTALRQMSIADLQRDFPKDKTLAARKLYPEQNYYEYPQGYDQYNDFNDYGNKRSVINVYINGVRECSANYPLRPMIGTCHNCVNNQSNNPESAQQHQEFNAPFRPTHGVPQCTEMTTPAQNHHNLQKQLVHEVVPRQVVYVLQARPKRSRKAGNCTGNAPPPPKRGRGTPN